jgi:hypothetical protein
MQRLANQSAFSVANDHQSISGSDYILASSSNIAIEEYRQKVIKEMGST